MSKFFFSVLTLISMMHVLDASQVLLRNRLPFGVPDATSTSHSLNFQNKRQAFAPVTTCGYFNGNPELPRTADPGYGCRVDTANGLWGFCPTTVVSAKDCGFAGVCVDSHSCSTGCGRLVHRPGITTFSCAAKQSCSTVILVNGPDQSFEYIACGNQAATETLFAVPKAVSATTTSSSTSTVSRSSSFATSTSRSIPSKTTPPSSTLLPNLLQPPTNTALPQQKPTNIVPIVGGVVGAIALICLTILGVLLIQRKRRPAKDVTQPPEYTISDRNDFVHNVELSTHNSRYGTKGYGWDGRSDQVEMQEGRLGSVEPVELPGKMGG